MAAYRRVYDSRHLQADCQELGSALEPYAWSIEYGLPYIFCLTSLTIAVVRSVFLLTVFSHNLAWCFTMTSCKSDNLPS